MTTKTLLGTLTILFLTLNLQAQSLQKIDQILGATSYTKTNSKSTGISKIDPQLKLTANQLINEKKQEILDDPRADLQKVSAQTSLKGNEHHRYQQTLDGIPIEGLQIIAHETNGILHSINGTLLTGLAINTTPSLTETAALAQVLTPHAKKYAWEQPDLEADLKVAKKDGTASYFPKGKLLILPSVGVSTSYHLAYRFQIYSIAPNEHLAVYVDAHTGKILQEQSLIRHDNPATGTGDTDYYGNRSFTCTHKNNGTNDHYELKSPLVETRTNSSYHGHGQAVANLTQNWSDNQDAVRVHWGTQRFAGYLYTTFGRKGYDDDNTQIAAQVGLNTSNAYWDGYAMRFGLGDGIFYNSFTSLDIIAHEYTHAMLSKIIPGGLQYAGESGAIEESYCDIFGELLERSITGDADWEVGADIATNGSSGFRILHSPRRYKDNYWQNGPSDNWGVHTNSKVHSYWFYILAEGNDSTVMGIGIDAAADLIFETLNYLDFNSDYVDLRNASIAVADMLFTNQAHKDDVAAAWKEVGLGFSVGMNITGIEPTTGDLLYGGFSDTIRWDTGLVIDMVYLEYSANGGSSWNRIDEVSYTDGFYLWNVPQNYSNKALLRITDTENIGIRGISEFFQMRSTQNTPPVAVNDTVNTIQGFFENFQPWLNDYDEGQLNTNSITIVSDLQASSGTTDNFGNSIRINVDPDFIGIDSLAYSICDEGFPILCATATIFVNAVQAPDTLWAMDDWGVLGLNETLSRNLMANDHLLDNTWSFQGWDTVSLDKGSLTIDNQGNYQYTGNEKGRDTIDYYVCNSDFSVCDTASLFLFTVNNTAADKDRMDLIILYEMTNGDAWINSWDTTAAVSTWNGVDLFNDDRVSQLNLASRNLNGTLPDFSSLNKLILLNLSDNLLTGVLPDFSNLSALWSLEIWQNDLNGVIPNFNKLAEVFWVKLQENQFRGNVPNFDQLTKITDIDLTDNQLSGDIPSFNNSISIVSLNLGNNQLSGAIPNFSTLNNLQDLSLINNQLTGTIPVFNNSGLSGLNLSQNKLEGQFPDLSSLSNLTNLNLANNLLTDSLPTSCFSNSPNLEYISLNNNFFTGAIPDLSNLMALKILSLHTNEFSGPLANFDNHLDLTDVLVQNNQLSGNLPQVTSGSVIDWLNFENNYFSGPVPQFNGSPDQISIEMNNLTFEGIENNFSVTNYNYYPQRDLPVFELGNKLYITASHSIGVNDYRWFDEEGATVSEEDSISPKKDGYYNCRVINSAFVDSPSPAPTLILYSEIAYFAPSCISAIELADNITLCPSDSLDARLSLMQSYTWWLDGNVVGNEQKLAVYYSGEYILQVLDQCSNLVSDTIQVSINNECVWPGDTNHDGIVNHFDLRNIGIHYGALGRSRDSTSTLFKPSRGFTWPADTNEGFNLKHVDANGDGYINGLDTLAIIENYGKTWKEPIIENDSILSPIRLIPTITKVKETDDSIYISTTFSLESDLDFLWLYGLFFETHISSPMKTFGTVQLDSNAMNSLENPLFISRQLDHPLQETLNIIQTALSCTNQEDKQLPNPSLLINQGVATENNLTTNDSLLVIEISTEKTSLTTLSGTVNSGGVKTPLMGGTTTLYYSQAMGFTLSPTPVSCGQYGQIQLNELKGNSLEYLWSDGQTTATATGLATGDYQLTVADALGNVITAAVTLGGIDKIDVDATITACANTSEIRLTPRGEIGNYSIIWKDGQLGPIATGLGSGSYTALIQDLGACTQSFSFTIEPAPVAIKVLLEGAYDPDSLLMHDKLRIKGLLPSSALTNACPVIPEAFTVSGPDALVDWVTVELRASLLSPAHVSVSGLLQRDGDVVGPDGYSPLRIPVSSGEYHIIVKHRNHLGVMTLDPISMENIPIQVDFTNPSLQTYGQETRKLLGGKSLISAGDADNDGKIDGADRSATWNLRNQSGYLIPDLDLDGNVNAADRSISWNNRNMQSQIP